MTIRLIELHRVMKPTASIYLHCDPTASHYLKVVMDTIWGPKNFRSEIIWRRTNAHNKTTLQYGPIHDTILFYSKTDKARFHPGTRPYSRAYIEDRFDKHDERGRYQTNYLTGPEIRNGASGLPWRGFNPTTVGRHWAIPKSLRPYLPNGGAGMTSQEQLEALYEQELIVFPKKQGGQPMYKQYVGPGVIYQDIWAYQPNTHGVLFGTDDCIDEDVKWLEDEPERLGYDTQKPEGLLSRIITTSSDPGDVVLDPFCGCGTAISVAEGLGRKWIGIDITHLAIAAIVNRMESAFPGIQIRRHGEPADLSGAQALALLDRYDFQNWALTLVAARPIAEDAKGKSKKGADRGIDGIISFLGKDAKTPARCLVQVKSGHVSSATIRNLVGTVDREKADIGLLITLEEPTGPMRTEALEAGFYRSEFMQRDYPRIQIITIKELLHGKEPQLPPHYSPYRIAERQRRNVQQPGLFEEPA